MKVCTGCRLPKSLDDFYDNPKTGGKRSRCKQCFKVATNAWRQTNHAKALAIQRKSALGSRLRSHGLTVFEFNDMVKAAEGRCAICGRPPQGSKTMLSVDHCHQTGLVRGLLCDRCNMGLGYFEDNPALLQQALKYLAESNSKP